MLAKPPPVSPGDNATQVRAALVTTAAETRTDWPSNGDRAVSGGVHDPATNAALRERAPTSPSTFMSEWGSYVPASATHLAARND